MAATGQGILGNNMFAYCLNSPVKFTDPLGTYVLPDDPLRGPVWMPIGGNATGVSSGTPAGGPDGFSISIGGLIRSIINLFKKPQKEVTAAQKTQSYNYNGLKSETYVNKRGWTNEMIEYTMNNGQQGTSINMKNGASCTAYKYPGTSNQYVVIEDSTGSIVQVSDFHDTGWIVDSRIQWAP